MTSRAMAVVVVPFSFAKAGFYILYLVYEYFTLVQLSVVKCDRNLIGFHDRNRVHKFQFFVSRVVYYSLPSYVCRVESNVVPSYVTSQ